MENKPSNQSAHSSTGSKHLPDLGSLWMHSRYGLCVYLGAVPFGDTGFNDASRLYTVYVFVVRKQHRTEGIFAPIDWHEQFTPVWCNNSIAVYAHNANAVCVRTYDAYAAIFDCRGQKLYITIHSQKTLHNYKASFYPLGYFPNGHYLTEKRPFLFDKTIKTEYIINTTSNLEVNQCLFALSLLLFFSQFPVSLSNNF